MHGILLHAWPTMLALLHVLVQWPCLSLTPCLHGIVFSAYTNGLCISQWISACMKSNIFNNSPWNIGQKNSKANTKIAVWCMLPMPRELRYSCAKTDLCVIIRDKSKLVGITLTFSSCLPEESIEDR
jgi:hypothetical protein